MENRGYSELEKAYASIKSFANCTSTEEFLEKALKQYLTKQQFIQVILHEKGAKYSLSYFKDISSFSIDSKINTSDFNSLFTKLKKTRKSAPLNSPFLKFTGSYLYKTYSTNDSRFIFFTGSNSFFPEDKLSKSTFENTFNILMPIFKSFYKNEAKTNKRSLIDLAITEIPQSSKQNEDGFFSSATLLHKKRLNLLGELFNILRHEISNPLFGLKLSADLFETDNLSPEMNDLFLEMTDAIKRSSDIINEFSDLFLNYEKFDNVNVRKILSKSISLTKTESRGVSINLNCDEKLIIKSNPTWLNQVFFNLIMNSVEALKENNIQNPVIHINLVATNASLIINIQDNGPGISQLNIQEIFKPYFTTKESGTGLGLPLCKYLIGKLNGLLEISSEKNKGTLAKIELPI